MKIIRCLFLLLTGSLASLACAQEKPVPLAPEQKDYLSSYETVRAALAADDLTAANRSAAGLLKASPKPTGNKPDATVLAAQTIANATSIEAARDAFKTVSMVALRLAKGQPGYFHAHCPMVPKDEGDWVQTSKKINNPYFGKSMLTCGSIE